MEEKINAYLLKQYASLGYLQRLLQDLKDSVLLEKPPYEYCELHIHSSMLWRNEWLLTNGLTMSEEEKKLWDQLSHEIQPL